MPFHLRNLLFVLIVFSLVHCKKKDNRNEDSPPPAPLGRISFSASSAIPSDIVSFRLDKPFKEKKYHVKIGPETTDTWLQGDSVCVFMVPVLPAGQYKIEVVELKEASPMDFQIKDYSEIVDVDEAISHHLLAWESVMDSLSNISADYPYHHRTEVGELYRELKKEWTANIGKIDAKSKELLSYSLARHPVNMLDLEFTNLHPDFYSKGMTNATDVGNDLIRQAKIMTNAGIICVASAATSLDLGLALGVAPSPLVSLLWIGSFTTFVVSMEVWFIKSAQVAEMKGVFRELTDGRADKTMEAEFGNNTSKKISATAMFSKLRSEDVAISSEVADWFVKEQSCVAMVNRVKLLYTSIKNTLTFTKTDLPTTTGQLGKPDQSQMEIPLKGNELEIISVSDERILFSVGQTNEEKVVTVSSNVAIPVDFTLKIAAIRTIDGKEMTFGIPCRFNPASAHEILALGGHNQTAYEHTELPSPLVVYANDIQGEPVPGVKISLKVEAGGGSVTEDTLLTNTWGWIAGKWTLGTAGPQRLTVSAFSEAGQHLKGSPFTFTATAKIDTLALLRSKRWTLDPTSISRVFEQGSVTCGGQTVSQTTMQLTGGSLRFTVSGYDTHYSETVQGIKIVSRFDAITCQLIQTTTTPDITRSGRLAYLPPNGTFTYWALPGQNPNTGGGFNWLAMDASILSISQTELVLNTPSWGRIVLR